jgi:energy-coupling factor transport system ATP-binding protein
MGLDPVLETPKIMSRHVGFVFQDPESQFVVDNVEDEIAFAMENAALPGQEMRVRVEETLDLLDLAPLRERALHTLSGGEKQRVAIAAALALRPEILVLDEPTSQLDPKSAEDVLNALVRLNHDMGLTVLLAEHRLERVVGWADRMVYLPYGGAEPLSDEPRRVMEQIDGGPPLVRLGKEMGWSPLPLTVKEGLRHTRNLMMPAVEIQEVSRPTSPPLVRAVDVTVAYGSKQALRGVSLDVRAGEIVTVLGRNGSGKSTLLRSLVGLVHSSRGRIEMAGRSIDKRETADICHDVAYLPQDPNALLFADTVMDEMRITLGNHGDDADGAAAQGRMLALLAQLRLADKAQDYPRDLSVGERQRVALAAVTVTEPLVLLLDEPTRGLDQEAKHLLVEWLNRRRSDGAAVLVVTHDVEFAAALSDRVLIMSQGEVIAEGAPREVLGTSPLFAPQTSRLFPGSGWLTPEVALQAFRTVADGQGSPTA